MSEIPPLQSLTPTDPVTPTDEPYRLGTGKYPARGTRRRVLGNGEGDYCIYVISQGEEGIPQGCLIPVPGIPRFENTNQARKWIRDDSGDLLANSQVIIFCAKEIINIRAALRQVVELQAKMKLDKPRPKTP
jgi:hypothetical protein